MDSGANLDAMFRRQIGVAPGEAPQDVERAARLLDHAAELDHDAIAGPLHDPPPVSVGKAH
jgi:hypothetical protein